MNQDLVLGILAAAGAGAFIDGAVAFQAVEAKLVGRQHGLRLSMMWQLLRRPQWLMATGGQVVGAGLQILALTLAPLTVVQPTLAVGLIVLLLIGSHRLGEHVGTRRWLAVVGMIGGITMLALSAPGRSTAEPVLWELAVVGGVLVLPMIWVRMRGELRLKSWQVIIAAGCGFALSAIAVKLLSDGLERDDWLAVVGWGIVAGGGALMGQVLDMTALQRYPATQVAPPIFAFEIVVPVALAPFLFKEDWSHPLVVILGLAIVVIGGAVVAHAPAVAHMQDEELEAELRGEGPAEPSGLAAGAGASGDGGLGDGVDAPVVAEQPEHDPRR
jgi:drug/metabolite transporter (DMT)-like permease